MRRRGRGGRVGVVRAAGWQRRSSSRGRGGRQRFGQLTTQRRAGGSAAGVEEGGDGLTVTTSRDRKKERGCGGRETSRGETASR